MNKKYFRKKEFLVFYSPVMTRTGDLLRSQRGWLVSRLEATFRGYLAQVRGSVGGKRGRGQHPGVEREKI